MEESIFVDEKLQGFNGDEDEPLHPSTTSLELVSVSTLKAEAPKATTSSTAAVETSRVEGEIISEQGAPSHIQKVGMNLGALFSPLSSHLSNSTPTLYVNLVALSSTRLRYP
jgi:hypothetical protein